MTWAMVTGASSGLGAEFARQLAADGHDVFLVSRDADALGRVADEVRAAGREAEVVVADLSVSEDVDAVAALLLDDARPVSVLVNNAGYGLGTAFVRTALEDEKAALDVMVRAVMVLSHAAARGMVARGEGGILNVASVASLVAGGPYSAHKEWVVVFSESLAIQLRRSGVRVTATRPGFIRTDFHRRANIDYSSLPGWSWVQSPPVVRESLRALRRGRRIVTPTVRYKLIVAILLCLPRPVIRALSPSRV